VAWTVFGPRGDTVRARGWTQHREAGWPVTDYGDLVSKLDRSLEVLAGDIRARLQALAADD
jgi:hypothetical protein